MAKRTRLAVILAKLEGTYGTDSVPTTTADAMHALEVELTPEIDVNERADMGITMSRLAEVGGAQRQMLKFGAWLKGSGTAGTAPKGLGAMLQSCGFKETLVAVTSATYALTSASLKSASIYGHLDGLLHKLPGCISDAEILLEANQLPRINFDTKGLWTTPTDTTFPTSYTPDTSKPKACKNLTATFDSYAAVIRSCSIKLNNTIAERQALAAATGIDGFDIVDRNPTGKIVIDAVPLATKDYWAKLVADTTVALSIVLNNGAGNIVTITAGQCRIQNIKYTDQDGVLAHEIEFQLSRSTADDELSIAFT